MTRRCSSSKRTSSSSASGRTSLGGGAGKDSFKRAPDLSFAFALIAAPSLVTEPSSKSFLRELREALTGGPLHSPAPCSIASSNATSARASGASPTVQVHVLAPLNVGQDAPGSSAPYILRPPSHAAT